MELDSRVHLAVEAFRGIGKGQEGNGRMDDVIHGLVAAYRKSSRDHASRGVLPRFTVGDHMMMARVTKKGCRNELTSRQR